MVAMATASSSEKMGTEFDLCITPMPFILVPVYCGTGLDDAIPSPVLRLGML